MPEGCTVVVGRTFERCFFFFLEGRVSGAEGHSLAEREGQLVDTQSL